MMPSYSEKLRKLREERHLTLDEVADCLGLPFASYRGIECFNELLDWDLQTIFKVLKFYNITSYFLLGGKELVENQYMPLDQFLAGIQAYIKEKRIRLEDFEELVGWELAEILKNPELILNTGIDCLHDVCLPLKFKWTHVLRGIEVQYKDHV